jgi:hypothetical protein
MQRRGQIINNEAAEDKGVYEEPGQRLRLYFLRRLILKKCDDYYIL